MQQNNGQHFNYIFLLFIFFNTRNTSENVTHCLGAILLKTQTSTAYLKITNTLYRTHI